MSLKYILGIIHTSVARIAGSTVVRLGRDLTNGNIDGRQFVQALKEQEDERWNKLHKQT